jgi:PhnB protein
MKMVPYLSLRDNCEEAMNYYQEVFGGKLEMMRASDSPIADQMPAEEQNTIMHACLMGDGFELQATGMTPMQYEVKEGQSVSVNIHFDTEADIEKAYKSLSEGGKVLDELAIKFWGDYFGVVQDKYGITWMLIKENS